MNQIEVQIMQQSYRLACPEGQQERLLQAVERVDSAMTRIRDAGKVRARERIAVLAALNLAFELADRAEAAAQGPAGAAEPAGSAFDASAPLPPPAAAPLEPTPAPALVPSQASLLADTADSGAPGGDALDALLRRLDQALGDDRRHL
ncbi:cell division protein ZapA [Acidovorax sp. NCPPB 4044]|uniref:cell division protein ZapA n=1 Tax=Acidovorax sp. NCPPB 4044 TaxID=2940490 RepID=UPI00230308F3|nr:cell division protein ZapA [Acidovorax sp. NCPPB 4044]MDA8520072.1 cell division protein ZapA [Acidovorax sp. NCPPB 4044]